MQPTHSRIDTHIHTEKFGLKSGLDKTGLTALAGKGANGKAITGKLYKVPKAPATTQVTSWADKGTSPDLSSGRWAMKGGPTKANFWKSGLSGLKATWSKKFPFIKFQKAKADFSNFVTDKVPKSALKLPPKAEVVKAPLGQRVLK